jgi:hypothetical protein
MPERELLIKEFLAFRVKITAAANETFEAWRERDHDDMVLAVALACWLGESYVPLAPPERISMPRPRTLAERFHRGSACAARGLFGQRGGPRRR